MIASWNQDIPGAKKEECGNYTYMDLDQSETSCSLSLFTVQWEHEYHYL